MKEEAVVVIRLDTGELPAKSQQAAAAIGSIGTAGQISARQTAAAMRTLPAQFTDVATQLAGGQNPLLILLQQGGQIKDSFGGIGPAIRAISAAINPVALGIGAVAAAVATLTAAAYQGVKQDEQLRDTLTLTGNAAGLTASRLQLLAERVSGLSEQTVGSARDIAVALAATGRTSSQAIDAQAAAVARLADLTGKSAEQIAASFAGQLDKPAEFAAKLNEQYNFLNVAEFKRIQQLEAMGRNAEAANLANEALVKSLSGQRQQLGYIETALESAAKWWSTFWNAALNVGREQTTRQQLDIAMSRLDALGGNLTPKAKAALEQRIQILKEELKLENQAADAAARTVQVNRSGIRQAQEDERERLRRLKDKQVELSAIRVAEQQYRQDFLRSEKAAYDQQEPEEARNDALGSFITDQLNAQQRRDEQSLARQEAYLQQLRDTTARGAAALIEDERARGEALIALDREIAQRRLEELGLQGQARAEALEALDEQALQARRRLQRELEEVEERGAREAAKAVRQDVTSALTAAFNDSRDPAEAFARGIATALYTRVTAALADAIATSLVGLDGRGGLAGDLMGLLSLSSGLSIDGAGIGITPGDGSIPLPTRGGLATGTNFVPRDMVVKVHRGEAVVPAKYNPAAGGKGAGASINFAPVINIDARTDQAQVAQLVYDANLRAFQLMRQQMEAEGR